MELKQQQNESLQLQMAEAASVALAAEAQLKARVQALSEHIAGQDRALDELARDLAGKVALNTALQAEFQSYKVASVHL